jgi:hypothetical protein
MSELQEGGALSVAAGVDEGGAESEQFTDVYGPPMPPSSGPSPIMLAIAAVAAFFILR